MAMMKSDIDSQDRTGRGNTTLVSTLAALMMVITGVSTSLSAQDSSFVVEGTVTLHGNAEGGAIAVRLLQEELEKETFTDPQGNYIFRNVAGGTYRLTATYPEYATYEEELTISSSQRRDLTLFLDKSATLSIVIKLSGSSVDVVKARLNSGMVMMPEDGSWTELEVIGDTASWDVEVPQGEWVLDLKASGYEEHSNVINALGDETHELLAVQLVEASGYDVKRESTCQSTPISPPSPSAPLIILASWAWFLIRKRSWSDHAV
jgi:hypothetical protein